MLVEIAMGDCFHSRNAMELTLVNRSMEGHIIGGEFARANQFPHAVFLTIECDEAWICGSSVLNQKILLTAAHCVDDITERCKFTASAGNSDLKKAKKRRVRSFVMHEKYHPRSVTSDIALVLLKNSLPLGNNIKRVFLKNILASSITEAIVAGWGVVSDITFQITPKLKYTKQIVRQINDCLKVTKVQKGMLCAESARYDNRPTRGDSGSALITPKGQQIGLVSFRKARYPDLVIYTHVPYYLRWIKRTAVQLYCGKI